VKNRRDQPHNEAWREGPGRRKGPGQCDPGALHAGRPVTTASVHRGTRGGLAVWLAAGVTYVGTVAAPCSGTLSVITTAAAVNAVAVSADALASVIIVVSFAPPAAA
jgi:hypothetical protein